MIDLVTAALVTSLGVLAALVIAVVLLRRRIAVVTVDGPSMEPTLNTGDRVLVRRAQIHKLQRGQIVVIEKPDAEGNWVTPAEFWPPGRREWLIKRITALPGDPLPPAILPAQGQGNEESVPAGRLVVLGDNAAWSLDSRQIGYFPTERVLGFVLRPLAR